MRVQLKRNIQISPPLAGHPKFLQAGYRMNVEDELGRKMIANDEAVAIDEAEEAAEAKAAVVHDGPPLESDDDNADAEEHDDTHGKKAHAKPAHEKHATTHKKGH